MRPDTTPLPSARCAPASGTEGKTKAERDRRIEQEAKEAAEAVRRANVALDRAKQSFTTRETAGQLAQAEAERKAAYERWQAALDAKQNAARADASQLQPETDSDVDLEEDGEKKQPVAAAAESFSIPSVADAAQPATGFRPIPIRVERNLQISDSGEGKPYVGPDMPAGAPATGKPKAGEPKSRRFAGIADELKFYATFLTVVRSRVKYPVEFVDDVQLAGANTEWELSKKAKGGARRPELDLVRQGYPYEPVRLWLEDWRLFPDLLSSAFVSVLTSIDGIRKGQKKSPIPLWELVRAPHLSTFAKWIGHQYLHDAQLANQWGGRSEGHVALAMSTRDAMSYFEALP